MKNISQIITIILLFIMTACSATKKESLQGIAELNTKVSKVRFDYIDNNSNNKISEQEFITYEKDKRQFREHSHINNLIESCDENGDKQISLDEIPEQNTNEPIAYEEMQMPNKRCHMNKHHFNFKDTNHDGILTFDELIAERPITPMPVPFKDRKEEMEKYLKEKYKKCDKDNDEKLTLKEATSTACHMPSADFTEADINSDEFLTLQEVLEIATKKYEESMNSHRTQPAPVKLPASAPKEVRLMMSMQRCDTNKDRKLSEAELTSESCGFTKEDFIESDHNKDGYFSHEDMAILNLLRNFKRLDSNQDEFLSFDEFRKNLGLY